MSLIADALEKLQKTRMEQAQKPGINRLRGMLTPMKQMSHRKRFLKARFIYIGIIVGSCMLIILLFRPFLITPRLHESEQKSLERQTTEPATQYLPPLSTEEKFSEKSPNQEDNTISVQSQTTRSTSLDSNQRPETRSDLTSLNLNQKPETRSDLDQRITSKSKLSETIRYYYNLGVTFQKQGQLSQAEAQYKKVIPLDPLNVEVHNNLGLIYKEMGKLDDAIEEYQKAISIDPEYWKAHHNLGVVFYMKGDLEKASAEYVIALKLNPKDMGIYNNLGLSYKNQGRFLDAENTFKEALSINPTYPETYYNLALTFEKEKNLSAAIYNYQKFIQFSSKEHNSLVEKVKNHLEKLGEGQEKK
ncbi:MAG: tetratricopeptide repeat protein [Candidatus Latescibacter sp.]|nr:tetratricopeptide repeat protein [Candidatus Latescibacter sp.]